jgi:RNA exonuclease 4
MKFNDVQREVAELIKDKVIVGHSLWNDLSGTWF